MAGMTPGSGPGTQPAAPKAVRQHRPFLRPVLLPLGVAALFVGEWVWRGALLAPWLSVLGLLSIAGSAWLAVLHVRDANGPGPWVPVPPALVLFSGVLLFVSSWVPAGVHAGVDWAGLLHGLWLLNGGMGLVLYGFVEAARPDMAARRPDTQARIGRAARSGVLLGLTLALIVTLNFVLVHLSWSWNLAYFKVTQPSEATQAEVARLPEPVEVGVFFAESDAPRPLVEDYFDTLVPQGTIYPNFSVQVVDAELSPQSAAEFKVRGNGVVVLRQGDRTKTIQIGTQLVRARAALRQFDGRFLAALLEMGRDKRIAYVTVGHGERNERGRDGARPDQRIRRFTQLLAGRNLDVQPLSYGDGLGSRIPEDASLVIIAGAETPFQPAEVEALRAYLSQGGSLIVFLEPVQRRQRADDDTPVGNAPLEALLAEYGMDYTPRVLANDLVYGRRSYTAADHALLVSTRYENHDSLQAIRRNDGQFPLFMLGSGGLKRGKQPTGMKVSKLVNAMPGTWSERNGNFVFDGTVERKDDFALVMAAEPRTRRRNRDEGRSHPTILVLADVDVASDLLLQNRANVQVLSELVNWVVGKEDSIGLPESEEDLRIQHAKGDDWLWFYLPVIGVPALVLLIGIVALGRVRRSRDAEAA